MRVKFSSDLRANFTGRFTLSSGSTLPTLLTCFVMCDILCNGPRFENNLEVLYGKHVKFKKKKGSYYHRRQNITFYFSDVYS